VSRIAAVLVIIVAGLVWAGVAQAEMVSKPLGNNVCLTQGGGKFVNIPNFVPHQAGDKIDRRLIEDIRWIDSRYNIYITDGYAMSGHSINGEHPLGLALDIVPVWGQGWKSVSALANFAEPRQNQPRQPWRWVGYNGDAGHGKGHHLHLSWNHGPSRPGKPVRQVYTRVCPDQGLATRAAQNKLRAANIMPLKTNCKRVGASRFSCGFRGAKFVATGNPAQATRNCTGTVKASQPWKEKTRIASQDCKNDNLATAWAKELEQHLLAQNYNKVNMTRCYTDRKKGHRKCFWRAEYQWSYTIEQKGTATRKLDSNRWNVTVK
jgi:hypothetical protein